MNSFSTISIALAKDSHFDILVDGKPLREHFAGRTGSHPSLVSPLGWSSAKKEYNVDVIQRFLGKKAPELKSGRIPVLVCEECGDVGCGAFAVRIEIKDGQVRWSDWAEENGYEEPSPLTWPTKPEELVFAFDVYEKELLKTVT